MLPASRSKKMIKLKKTSRLPKTRFSVRMIDLKRCQNRKHVIEEVKIWVKNDLKKSGSIHMEIKLLLFASFTF